MFAKVIESEIEWCEQNDGAMPAEFRKGFVAGLKQAVYLINATIQRSVWQDGEIVDDDDLLDRVAEQRDAPVHAEQKCPACNGTGILHGVFSALKCSTCNGTGISNRSAGG